MRINSWSGRDGYGGFCILLIGAIPYLCSCKLYGQLTSATAADKRIARWRGVVSLIRCSNEWMNDFLNCIGKGSLTITTRPVLFPRKSKIFLSLIFLSRPGKKKFRFWFTLNGYVGSANNTTSIADHIVTWLGSGAVSFKWALKGLKNDFNFFHYKFINPRPPPPPILSLFYHKM